MVGSWVERHPPPPPDSHRKRNPEAEAAFGRTHLDPCSGNESRGTLDSLPSTVGEVLGCGPGQPT